MSDELEIGDQAIQACCEHVVRQLDATERPEMLWHYTDTYGFNGIIESQSFHLTNIRFLNDAREFLHSIEIMQIAASQYQLRHQEPEAQFILNELLAAMAIADEHFVPRTFVCCFSKARDDLSQWRAYGGGLGFALGFNPSDLEHFGAHARLYPCIYDHSAQVKLLATLIGNLIMVYLHHGPKMSAGETICKTAADRLIKSFQKRVGTLTSTFKHHGFASEAEWRLVEFNPPLSEVQYHPKRESLTPFIDIAPAKSPLPIKRICIGPGKHNRATAQAVMDLLEGKQLPQLVPEVSDIPHRPMI